MTTRFMQTLLRQLLSGNGWLRPAKWAVAAVACAYLACKLLSFDCYDLLWMQWVKMPFSQWGWFVAVLALLPANWLLEAIKWKFLTTHVQKISLTQSVFGVLAGVSTGFLTPNRVGEMAGRILYLEPGNRKAGVTMSLLNSLTQNLIMILCGLPACVAYFLYTAQVVGGGIKQYFLVLVVLFVVMGLFYLFLPQLGRLFLRTNIASKVLAYTEGISSFSRDDLIRIVAVSLLRYVVFCMQFFFMLRFFGVQLLPVEALVAIPANYLFVTFSPSFAFSEVVVRGSSAVFFIGAFSGQTVGIALAGACIWVVNFLTPVLAGSVVLLKR